MDHAEEKVEATTVAKLLRLSIFKFICVVFHGLNMLNAHFPFFIFKRFDLAVIEKCRDGYQQK